MKNLADFKKRLVKGVKIHTTYHQSVSGRDENGNLIFKDKDKGTREVNIVQSNAFTLLTPDKTDPDKLFDSWCYYPKASEIKILDENTVLILDADFRVRGENQPLIPCLTYKFV